MDSLLLFIKVNMFVSRTNGPSAGFTAGGVVIDTSVLISVGISVILVHILLLRTRGKVLYSIINS